MPGPAPRRDPGGDVTEQATRAVAREAIQVRDARGLELRFAGLGSRQSSEAVEGKQNDLGVVAHDERLDQIEHGLASVLSLLSVATLAQRAERGLNESAGTRGA